MEIRQNAGQGGTGLAPAPARCSDWRDVTVIW
jgi:hypothetical protein